MGVSKALRPSPDGASEAEFSASLEEYRRRLYGVARRSTGSPEAAEDVVQETILCAFRSRHSFDGRRDIGSWLFGILHNQLKNAYAQNAREHKLLEETRGIRPCLARDGCTDPEEAAVTESAVRELHDALDRLPSKWAEPLRLYYFLGQDVRSVAERLEISEQNAKVRLFRARKALRKLLRE